MTSCVPYWNFKQTKDAHFPFTCNWGCRLDSASQFLNPDPLRLSIPTTFLYSKILRVIRGTTGLKAAFLLGVRGRIILNVHFDSKTHEFQRYCNIWINVECGRHIQYLLIGRVVSTTGFVFSSYDSVHDHSQLWRASVSKITTQRSPTASHLLKNEENYMEGQTKIELQKWLLRVEWCSANWQLLKC